MDKLMCGNTVASNFILNFPDYDTSYRQSNSWQNEYPLEKTGVQEDIKNGFKFKVGDRVKIINDDQHGNFSRQTVGYEFTIKEIFNAFLGGIWYREHKGVSDGVREDSLELVLENNLIKKNMNSIVKFAKNLTLSEDEKALRATGLHNEEGNWTGVALELVLDFKAVSLGYKDAQDMLIKLGSESKSGCFNYSTLETHFMFVEYKDALLDIAKKKLKEDKLIK